MKQVILNWLKSNQADKFKAEKLEEYFDEKLNFMRFQRNEFNRQNKELIKAYDEYVEFLGKELSRHEAMTVVRPYMAASEEVIDKGVELRAIIEQLKTPKK